MSRSSRRDRAWHAGPSCRERTCGGGAQTFLLAGAAIFAVILVADFGVAKYQEMRVRDRGARIAQLAEMALSSLQGEVQSVSDLGASWRCLCRTSGAISRSM
jgi:hypothetical protein